jgi:regulator of protease activity HflC (stomatin/prohibitin superfamily)
MEILVAIAILVIAFMAKGFKIVQQSETMVIERLGRYNRTLSSGINIIWPFIDQPRSIAWRTTRNTINGQLVTFKTIERIDLRETVYDFPSQNVITKDNVNVEINALLYFQIMDPVKSVYEIENLPNAIEKLTQTTLRNIIGELELDETLTSRDTINAKLRVILDEATNKWGVKINRVELQDINPPKEIKSAMEKQMRAERDRRAQVLEAEGNKQAMILEAQGKKESEINQAEGDKQSQILRAEAEAEAKIKVAQAEAESIRLITEAIDKNAACDPAKYLIAMKYIETLGQMTSGDDTKTVYIPYEATGVLSSIGGIKDMLEKTK